MEKLKMQTPNITEQNIEQIAKLFPNVMTETQGENGKTVKAIDFDLLKQSLSSVLVEDSDERYRLDWPGKKAALLKANTPITKTLRPCREDSVNFDSTENVYIEGDNFEVLKILQESYLGKIKMIYIDPPYNTGKDFIYKDNFTAKKADYEEELGTTDEEDNKLFKNTDTNGRFHSDWLSMMYERLIVARDLLKEDGVIFISIDDNEQTNLKKIADEIFGENNLIGAVCWKSKYGAGAKTKGFIEVHEYVLCYSKQEIQNVESLLSDDQKKIYDKNKDDKYNERGGYVTQPLMTNSLDDRKNLQYEITHNGDVIQPRKQWVWSQGRLLEAIKNNEVVFKKKDNAEYSVRAKVYLKDQYGSLRKGKPLSLLNGPFNQEGTKEVAELIGNNIFSFPKPVSLIKYFFSFTLNDLEDKNGVYLDFFSGSCSSAHAVMKLNAEDSGKRKFIMVQLPEATDEKSEAYKAGYQTIAEIGKERIRRAGQKIVNEKKERAIVNDELLIINEKKERAIVNDELLIINENKHSQSTIHNSPLDKHSQSTIHNSPLDKHSQSTIHNSPLDKHSPLKNNSQLDTGFRVYKTDSSNMKEVYYHPDQLKQSDLFTIVDNIKDDRTPDDLLTQVILDLGLELNLPIEQKIMHGNTVFIVQTNALVACFDDNINTKIIDEIAQLKPFKVVFKDASFSVSKDRINLEERFKRLSPETLITVI